MHCERVTVTMPAHQVREVRHAVSSGKFESISAYVSRAVRDRLDKDAALEELIRREGCVPVASWQWQDVQTWARRILEIEPHGECDDDSSKP